MGYFSQSCIAIQADFDALFCIQNLSMQVVGREEKELPAFVNDLGFGEVL